MAPRRRRGRGQWRVHIYAVGNDATLASARCGKCGGSRWCRVCHEVAQRQLRTWWHPKHRKPNSDADLSFCHFKGHSATVAGSTSEQTCPDIFASPKNADVKERPGSRDDHPKPYRATNAKQFVILWSSTIRTPSPPTCYRFPNPLNSDSKNHPQNKT